jgi:hypothetical protein
MIRIAAVPLSNVATAQGRLGWAVREVAARAGFMIWTVREVALDALGAAAAATAA